MATLGTEDSGRCREWQLWRGLNKIQCMEKDAVRNAMVIAL